MLNRRFLRVKVLQALYAFLQSGNENLVEGLKNLNESIDRLYDFFVYQLSFLVETRRFAERRIYENQHKHLPSPEDLNPNTRFVENRVLTTLEDNFFFKAEEERLKINWSQHQELPRDFYEKMIESEIYKKYTLETRKSFDSDKKFLVNIIDFLFEDLITLQDFYEEKTNCFVDDYSLVNSLLMKYINDLTAKSFDNRSKLPTIYKTASDKTNADKDFVETLFREVVKNEKEYGDIIAAHTDKWEKERICVMDMLLLKMALAELIKFKEIPVKVTINEYIEISKYFSTPKSKAFINGIVDRLVKRLQNDGTIVKTGLGLLEK